MIFCVGVSEGEGVASDVCVSMAMVEKWSVVLTSNANREP